MPAIDHPSTELALGGQIYWRDLAQQLASVWWQVAEVGGNIQHGDLDADTTFSIVLPLHGGYCFHGPTPMDAWTKAKKWLMSPDRRFEVELPSASAKGSPQQTDKIIEWLNQNAPADVKWWVHNNCKPSRP